MTDCAPVKAPPDDPGDDPDVRPVGMGERLRFAFWSALLEDPVLQAACTHFEPVQLGLSRNGGLKLVLGVTLLLDGRPDFIVLRLDLKNAHNSFSRARCLDAFLKLPPGPLRDLARLVWQEFRFEANLYAGDAPLFEQVPPPPGEEERPEARLGLEEELRLGLAARSWRRSSRCTFGIAASKNSGVGAVRGRGMVWSCLLEPYRVNTKTLTVRLTTSYCTVPGRPPPVLL